MQNDINKKGIGELIKSFLNNPNVQGGYNFFVEPQLESYLARNTPQFPNLSSLLDNTIKPGDFQYRR